MVILHDFLESSRELGEILHKNGLTTRFASMGRDEIKEKRLSNPIFFAQLAGDESTVKQRVSDIAQIKHLHPYPVIILGPKVQQFSSLLSHFFKHSLAIDTPFTPDNVLDAIKKIETLEHPDAINKNLQNKQEQSNFINFFTTIHKFSSIQQQNLGGSLYILASAPENITDQKYLPKNDEVLEALKILTSIANKHDIAHIHRTAFASNSIINALDPKPQKLEEARVAALLHAWSLLDDSRLTRIDYSNPKISDVRKQISERIEKSAVKIAEELKLSGAASIVSTLARIVGDQVIKSDDENSLLASCIFAADLIDRTCWQSGSWDPGSAYRILIKCKVGTLGAIPPQIVSCVLKLMLEAVESTAPQRMLPRSVSTNQELLTKAEEYTKSPLTDDEKRVFLSALAPGMKLKRPLEAFDGKILIPQDVVLDVDMIWRIWSLSAVRALNTPLVVENF
jgi:hypothetical protein